MLKGKVPVIAIASGKGGVGKSTTTVNIALTLSREGFRVAIADIDPLSDLAVILDIDKKEIENVGENFDSISFDSCKVKVFENLDLLFPNPKLKKNESKFVFNALFSKFPEEISSKYDIVLLDMPAGIGADENLSFIPKVDYLILVVTSEPTSHVSGGGYVKAIREFMPKLPILLWHNKFNYVFDEDFNPRELIKNYNRLVPEDLQLSVKETANIRDLAFIPFDSSLDLLRADSSFHHILFGRIEETILAIDENLVSTLEIDPPRNNIGRLLRYYVMKNYPKISINGFLSFCRQVSGNKNFELSPSSLDISAKYITAQKHHPLRPWIIKTRERISHIYSHIRDSEGFNFNNKSIQNLELPLLKAVADVLEKTKIAIEENKRAWAKSMDPVLEKLSAILLTYIAVLSICSQEKVKRMLVQFVPKKKNTLGQSIRDRRSQIRLLVEHDADYHKKYFALVKTLYPVLVTQLNTITKRPGWQRYLLRQADGKVNANAYLKLFSMSLHDMVNAGLGLSVGIKHNQTSQALRKAVQDLVREAKIRRQT